MTPYTAVTRVLQNDLAYQTWFGMARGMLFTPANIKKLYLYLLEITDRKPADFAGVADKADAMLDAWAPEGAFETNCYLAMRAAVAMVRASGAFVTAIDMHPLYFKAAKLQFEKPEEARAILESMVEAFCRAAEEMRSYSTAHATAIEPTGQTRLDLMRLEACSMTVDLIAELIEEEINELDRIPLARFERLVDYAVEGKFIVT